PQGDSPQSRQRRVERCEARAVSRYAVVPRVAQDDRAQIRALLRNRFVQTTPQLGIHLAQLRLPPPSHRLPQHRKPSLPRLAAHRREAEEIEGLRFPVTPPSPVAVGEPTDFDEARFVGMQRQSTPREPVAQLAEKAFRFLAMLESDDEIVREPHHDDFAVRLRPTPSLNPEVEYVVE